MPLSGKMFVKEHGTELEVELQNIAASYCFSPRISKTERNGARIRIFMEDVEELSVGDTYGEDPSEVPSWIWSDIRTMIGTLYDREGIEYIDINPYNFIEKDGRIYIIDFGDAKYSHGEPNWFLSEFLDGENSWNPDYK